LTNDKAVKYCTLRAMIKDKIYESKHFSFNSVEFKDHLEFEFEDWMNWENYGEWEIDHITPLSKGGKWELYNLRPIRKEENRRKKDKLYI